MSIDGAPGTVLDIEDTKIIHVFTLIRKVDMETILQSQGVSYIQKTVGEWSGQVSQRPAHYNSLFLIVFTLEWAFAKQNTNGWVVKGWVEVRRIWTGTPDQDPRTYHL